MAARKQKKPAEEARQFSVVENRKARHDYEVIDTYEAGMVLRGTEVKTMRQGQVHLEESYGRIRDGAAWLIGAHVDEYTYGNRINHEPTRPRKLLLHKRELKKIEAKTAQKGLTLVPLKIYFGPRGYAKVLLGICRGRKKGDKREGQRKRDAMREIREDR